MCEALTRSVSACCSHLAIWSQSSIKFSNFKFVSEVTLLQSADNALHQIDESISHFIIFWMDGPCASRASCAGCRRSPRISTYRCLDFSSGIRTCELHNSFLGLELFARWAEACTWSTRIQTGSEWDQGCGVQNATSSWLASSWQTFEAKIWFCLRVYKLYLVGGIFHIHMLNLNDCFMFQAAERWSGPTQWIAMRVPRDWPCTGWRLLATRPQMQKRLRSLSIAWGLHWVGLLWLSEWLQMVLRFKLRIGRTCSSTMPSWLATCREILEPPT